MFICAKCGQLSAPRERMVREVVETRETHYPERRHGDHVLDAGGVGREIVEERAVHAVCPTMPPVAA